MIRKAIYRHGAPYVTRAILTLALIWGVYTETGIWTALAVGLVYLGGELHQIQHKIEGIKRDLFGPMAGLAKALRDYPHEK